MTRYFKTKLILTIITPINHEVSGQTHSHKGTKLEIENTVDHHDSNSSNSSFSTSSHSKCLSQTYEVTDIIISDMKYVANFPVTISHNRKISLFDTGATISCMSKSHFDKLQPQPQLVKTSAYRVNCADGNGLGPIGMTTHTLKFRPKFQWQFIVCKNLLCPVILGLDFPHNNLIGINSFSSNQLHLHQGLKSIVKSDPTQFPLHVNQISTLPLPHILVKTVSQVTTPYHQEQ